MTPRPTLNDLIEVASKLSKYSVEDIKGHRRFRPLTRVRFAVIWLAHDNGNGPLSLTEIGRRLNGRDHATICHARNQAERLLRESKAFKMLVDVIRLEAKHFVERRVRKVSQALDAAA